MIDLIFLARLRWQVHQANHDIARPEPVSGGIHRQVINAAPKLVPMDAAGDGGQCTCQCGRYSLDPAQILHWTKNPATQALETESRMETPGLVTSLEKARWARGEQSRCSDASCPMFATHHRDVEHALSPRGDAENAEARMSALVDRIDHTSAGGLAYFGPCERSTAE